ncbi:MULTISPECIES: hypothetical protein [unclassified Flavobacterium]|uniref:hypothetical protein n=1 Tax=unclassified Flavobacterium TaxID=196869 RepID=UPI00129251C5|nr:MULTISPECIES: hypothetical protein [unclassified Flavobacterium]MQP51250.1 hypothetical protein [Flavobacterium sp. LMO9]MQP61521.1 hypothetical protein [Flavobacterium sp. LMO6]
MNNIKIEPLNTFLIILSFALAYVFPFELFVLSYAILGPLHYLTEINWVRDQEYFVANKLWIYLALGLAFLISIRITPKISFLKPILEHPITKNLTQYIINYSNNFFLIALLFAFAFLFYKSIKKQVLFLTIGILLMFFLKKFSIYNILIGVFLPTLIHVYIFTLIFMWYGNTKSKSTNGYLNILLLTIIPLIVTFISIDNSSYHFSDTIKKIIIDNNFYILNTSISKLFNINDGTTFFFYEIIDLKIQIFIAFAYTYHYLNWFSKTSIIGWHRKISKRKSIVILTLWLLSISIYLYDYTLGLSVLLFLSVLHVLVEFPLNIITISSLIKSTPLKS